MPLLVGETESHDAVVVLQTDRCMIDGNIVGGDDLSRQRLPFYCQYHQEHRSYENRAYHSYLL